MPCAISDGFISCRFDVPLVLCLLNHDRHRRIHILAAGIFIFIMTYFKACVFVIACSIFRRYYCIIAVVYWCNRTDEQIILYLLLLRLCKTVKLCSRMLNQSNVNVAIVLILTLFMVQLYSYRYWPTNVTVFNLNIAHSTWQSASFTLTTQILKIITTVKTNHVAWL